MVEKIIESIITNTLVVSILGFIFSRLYERSTNYFFERKLENYKSELDKISQIENDIRVKKQFESNKYSEEKYLIYPRLFKKCMYAYSSIKNLWGLRTLPDFNEYSKSDIEKYFENKKIIKSIKEEILSLWDTDKKAAVEKVNKNVRILDYYQSESILSNANNYFLLNELYLSDLLVEKLSIFFSIANKIQVFNQFNIVEHYCDKDQIDENRTNNEKFDLTIKELKEIMRKDLRVGYFE